MKILLSEIIKEISERVWENQTIENFWVNNKTGLEKSERRVSEDISNYKIVRNNYFAYNPYRINVWSIGLFTWELWAVSPAYLVFKVDEEKIIPSLLLHFLKSERWLIEINQHTHGWVRKSLSIWDLGKIGIDIPEIDKQRQFIELSQKHSDVIEKIWIINIDNQDLVKKLRQSILQDAIQGRLVSQDPNDEPASELLKKIQQEKERLIKEKKIKKGKDLVPITNDEIPFDLPKGWTWCTFEDISINRDWLRIPVSQSERDIKEKIYDYYGASGVIDKIDWFTHDWSFLLIGEDWSNLRLRSNSIAFIARWQFRVNNHAHILEFLNENTLRYMEYCVNATDISDYVTWWFQPKLSQWMLNKIPIPLPPISEQQRIVAKVDELMKFCDSLDQEVTEAKENWEKLMESVLGEVFR